MSWLYSKSIVSKLNDNVYLYDLSLGTSKAIIGRIPDDTGGIYVWYRHFESNAGLRENPDDFFEYISQELSKPHCVTRETRIPPAYKVRLSSDPKFSKQEKLKEFAQDRNFRNTIISILENSLILQQPLYIGKTTNFRWRIQRHLNGGSALRSRLSDAGHDIDQCKLLIIALEFNGESVDYDEHEDEDILESDLIGDSRDLLLEDILSRLFLPSFTVRYG